jgi:Tfp pilus assembly protein FimV
MSTMTFTQAPVRTRRAVRSATPATRRVRRPSSHSHLRLTRRGRLVVVLTVATLAMVAMMFGRGEVIAGSETSGAAVTYRVVEPGDTLWGIAQQIRPETDPRVTIQRIKDINGLSSVQLRAGERLIVPAAPAA